MDQKYSELIAKDSQGVNVSIAFLNSLKSTK